MENFISKNRQSRNDSRPGNHSVFGDFLMGDSPVVRAENQSRTMKRLSENFNVQKSLAMLEKAVSTPNPLLRTTAKTPLKHSTYTPQKVTPVKSAFDVSNLLGPVTPAPSIMATPGKNILFGESMEYNYPVTPGNTTRLHEATFGADVTNTNATFLLEDDPGLAASGGLYGEFLQCFKGYTSENQIFEKVSAYENMCDEQSKLLKKLVQKTTPGQNKFAKTLNMCSVLVHEKNTWRLIGSLYRDRLENDEGEEEAMAVDSLNSHVSDKEIVNKLYETDARIRRSQLVVDWLEQMAAEDLDHYYDKVEFFTDQSGAWENTLYSLQQKSSGIIPSHDRSTVSELDPDAPIRQRLPLADLDQDDEARLLKYLLACVRAGQLDEAQRLCVKCGQAWRAATLEGWRLYHDPNYDSPSSGYEVNSVEGNPYRDVWKSVCWAMSEEDQFHMCERALYAALSGNLKELLPACLSWEDHLWAYLKVMIDRRVEQEIRLNTNSQRSLQKLPPIFWEKMLTPETVFQEIHASPNENVKREAQDKFHLIQKYIILDDTDGLIEEMYEWSKDAEQATSQHLSRFMAHVVLFLRVIGQETKTELCTSILESYVQHLIDDRQINLIATYVATLPQYQQVEWYARFLEGITDNEERQLCLNLAEEAGLDIHEITKTVVENIRSRDIATTTNELQGSLEAVTSQEDRKVIDSIDWLVFDPAQRSEAIRQANTIMRAFLGLRKHAAAKEIFRKIPKDSIDVIVKHVKMQTGSTVLPPADENSISEYLCIQAYLEALDSFNDWFDHYMNAKPTKPVNTAGANFTERVAYEHKQKQYEAELERWQRSLALQTEHTVQRIHNVLLFVSGGWMVDVNPVEDEDTPRTAQMLLLRQICLPIMASLLHNVLHSTQQYKQCLQIADLIASEDHKLYTVFSKDELQKLMQKLRESSLALLDQNMDPLGYPLS